VKCGYSTPQVRCAADGGLVPDHLPVRAARSSWDSNYTDNVWINA